MDALLALLLAAADDDRFAELAQAIGGLPRPAAAALEATQYRCLTGHGRTHKRTILPAGVLRQALPGAGDGVCAQRRHVPGGCRGCTAGQLTALRCMQFVPNTGRRVPGAPWAQGVECSLSLTRMKQLNLHGQLGHVPSVLGCSAAGRATTSHEEYLLPDLAAQVPQLLPPPQYVVSRRGLPESEARWFFQQLMLGMDYCHRKGGSSSAVPLLVTVD